MNILLCLSSIISSKLNTQLRFLQLTGRLADLKNPKTFSEKLSWLKIHVYATDPLVKQCADKYQVRAYVKKCGYEALLNELLAVYHDPKEICIEKLPEKFVLKWNFGCGYNIVCKNKSEMDWKKTKHTLKKWKHKIFWLRYSEKQYKIKEKYLLCEKYLEPNSDAGLLDYKLYCFHGKVLAILVIGRNYHDDKAAVFMSPQWEYLSDIPGRYRKSAIFEKPRSLELMVEAAEKLAEPFPFVRIDFYENRGKAIFGEMTFTPASGVAPSETNINKKDMGEYLNLEHFRRK